MDNNFETIRELLPIEQVAQYLLGKPAHNKLWFYPGEKTASIRIYPATRSFYDFGRATGGDAIKLWCHVRGVDSGQAIREICEEYGITLDRPDRMEIARSIRRQEQEKKRREDEAKSKRKMWLFAVERAKAEIQAVNNVLETARPFSDEWCFCVNRKQHLEHILDCLCGC